MSVLSINYTLSANGETKEYNVPVSTDYMFYASGTFGAGALTLEASPDNGVTWFAVERLTNSGRVIRYLVSGEKVRICLTGAISPNLSFGIRQ